MGWRAIVLPACLLLVGLPALAQEQGAPVEELPQGVTVLPSPILTIDQEALFTRSAFGRRVRQDLEEASRKLGAENRQMEAAFAAEERELTEVRKTLPVDEFRARAAAFDQRVEATRAQQDAKTRNLNRTAEQERKRFLDAAFPILKTLIGELGAVAIVDARAIVLSSQSIDITDAAIARLDDVMGSGTSLPEEEAPTTVE